MSSRSVEDTSIAANRLWQTPCEPTSGSGALRLRIAETRCPALAEAAVRLRAIVYSASDEEQLRKMAFVVNVVRKNLTAAERANAMHEAQRDARDATGGLRQQRHRDALLSHGKDRAAVPGQSYSFARTRRD